jgi:hypothetical protein
MAHSVWSRLAFLVRADIFIPAERLGFVHPIVRAALYEDLAPGERQARHAAAAAALAREGASAERVTAHLLLTPPTGVVSGGRSAEAAVDALSSLAGELWSTDPGRSLELGSELLIVMGSVPPLRPGLAARLGEFRELARGRPVSRPWRGSSAPRTSSCTEHQPRPPRAKSRRPSWPACRPAR